MLVQRFTRFSLVGGVATAIQYSLLVALVHGAGMNAVLSSSIGFIVSALANYFLNYHYTFRSSERHSTTLLKFTFFAGVGLALNSGIMHLFIEKGLRYLLAQIFATLLVLLWNFTGNSLWTFRRSAFAERDNNN